MFQKLWLIFLVFTSWQTSAQEFKTVFYHLDKVSIKGKYYVDSLKSIKEYKTILNEFNMNGFVGVYPTDTVFKKNQIHYYFKADKVYKKVKLQPQNALQSPQLNRSLYGTINSINDEIVTLEDNGFPFAQIKILKQSEGDEELILHYKIDSGSFFIIDKIHIKSKSDFHEKTVLGILGLKTGDPYNEGKIRKIPEILKNSDVYTSPKSPEVLFREGKAEIFVYIDKKKSSSADGYVGFQQDQTTQELTLNGYVNLALKNALNRAETIHLNWKNNPDQSQNLNAIFEYPYLLGTPLGIGTNLDLQKQDSTFVRSNIMFELIYNNPQFRISIFDQIENSTTLGDAVNNEFRDYSKNTIGATFFYRPFLPEALSFYHPTISLSAGVFNYRADTLDQNSEQIANRKYSSKYSHKIDFLNFFHLNNSLHFQGINSSIGLARNEYIYFGGLQTVRGFYELELEGREIWILQNELEFKPVELLSMKLIYDYANFKNNEKHFTHSIGFGFGLINNNSQLDIIVANGKLDNNPITVSNTKIHIGFKSNF